MTPRPAMLTPPQPQPVRHRYGAAALAGLALAAASLEAGAREVQYVESPDSDPDTIALGYPVPQPRAQAAPFAGFRDLAGIQARMAELALQPDGPRLSLLGRSRAGQPIEQLCFGPAATTPRVLQTGGIHAREWASPEAVLGIAEALAAPGNQPLLAWLADTQSLCLVPVLNPDGFGHTQDNAARTRVCVAPEDGDPPADCEAETATPRDGRMRRKNLRDSDGDFASAGDALLGVDLNRNAGPFWASSTRSSAQPESIVHHGPARASEPEVAPLEALVDAAAADVLRLYIDTHSFSRLYFWNCTGRPRLDSTAQDWVERFRLAARRSYANVPTGDPISQRGCGEFGIGATDELFGYTLNVPAYTLELEPSFEGGGGDYGGFGVSHDGFILPESIVPLMRQDALQMAAVAYTLAAGPAWLRQVELRRAADDALLYRGRWSNADADARRALAGERPATPQPGEAVRLLLDFDRPLPWRNADGTLGSMPGLPQTATPELALATSAARWELDSAAGRWAADTQGYAGARFVLDATLPANWDPARTLRLEVEARDISRRALDADPASAAVWRRGAFDAVEAGVDRSHALRVGTLPEPRPTPPRSGGGGGSGGSAGRLWLLGLLRILARPRGRLPSAL